MEDNGRGKRKLTGGGSTKSSLGKGSRIKTVKLVSPGSLLAPMLIAVEDGGGVELGTVSFRGPKILNTSLLGSEDRKYKLRLIYWEGQRVERSLAK
jgi:hypothetical protein